MAPFREVGCLTRSHFLRAAAVLFRGVGIFPARPGHQYTGPWITFSYDVPCCLGASVVQQNKASEHRLNSTPGQRGSVEADPADHVPAGRRNVPTGSHSIEAALHNEPISTHLARNVNEVKCPGSARARCG